MPAKKTAAAQDKPTTTAAEPAASTQGQTATQEAYCVKCKTKREMKDPHETVTNGRRMLKGICPVCGTTMNRILGKA